jgi:hypothetical protein
MFRPALATSDFGPIKLAGCGAPGMAASADADPRLAAEGFHRIGRVDAVGRRSLWLREEIDAVELRAGREGRDASVRITESHPLYREMRDVLAGARFAAEWEASDGAGLEPSFAIDRNAASIHCADEEMLAPNRPFSVDP